MVNIIDAHELELQHNIYDTDLFKTDFNWLINEMLNAGYNTSWFTSPHSIGIKVSIPSKK